MGNAVKAQALVTVAAPVRSSTLGAAIANPTAPAFMKEPGFMQAVHFDITRRLKTLHYLLLFHGDRDVIVPVSHAHEIHAMARAPKRLYIQQNGDHRMSDPQHQAHFIDATVAWFAEHLK
jgi:dipeptidyl aminopeptidase/acylaminoacyl peptidase